MMQRPLLGNIFGDAMRGEKVLDAGQSSLCPDDLRGSQSTLFVPQENIFFG